MSEWLLDIDMQDDGPEDIENTPGMGDPTALATADLLNTENNFDLECEGYLDGQPEFVAAAKATGIDEPLDGLVAQFREELEAAIPGFTPRHFLRMLSLARLRK